MLGSDTDTGFVALINNGGANVERFNYREMEGLVVNTLAGNDYVVLRRRASRPRRSISAWATTGCRSARCSAPSASRTRTAS